MKVAAARMAAGVAVVLTLVVCRVQAQAADGELPYELAFDRHTIDMAGIPLTVSGSGRYVAYEVQRAPANIDITGATRFMPNGTPTGVLGVRIRVTDLRSGKTRTICPQEGQLWRPSWSPVDDRLAFYSDADGQPRLWLYEPETQQCRRVADTRIKAKHWVGDEPQWSPDARTLYVPAVPEEALAPPAAAGNERQRSEKTSADVLVLRSLLAQERVGSNPQSSPDSGHFISENNAALAAIDVHTGAETIVVAANLQPLPSVLRLSASGRWMSYLSVIRKQAAGSWRLMTDLAVVSAQGGAVHLVAANLQAPAVDFHRRNYSWHPQEDLLVYVADQKLWLVEIGSDGPRPPRQLGASAGAIGPSVHWFTEDGKAVIVATEPTDEGSPFSDAVTRGLAAIPLDGGPVTYFNYDNQRWSFIDVVKASSRTVWQPQPATVTAQLREKATGQIAIVRLSPELRRSRVLWSGPARLGTMVPVAKSDDLYVVYEDLHTPADIYRWSGNFSRRQRISAVEPRLDNVKVGDAGVFETTVPLYDGTLGTVRSTVLMPPGARQGDRLPTIVVIYPDADLSIDANRFGGGAFPGDPPLAFTSRGYAVMQTHLDIGPGGEAGNAVDEMVDVLLPQVYRAAALGYVDIKRLALRGQSGGAFAAAAIVSRTKLFRAAVPSNGPYDLGGIYGRLFSERFPVSDDTNPAWMSWVETGGPRLGTHPWANVLRYIENSPYYRADKITTPMLIVQGTDDTFMTDAEKLYSALKRLGRPAELAIYRGGGHYIGEWHLPNAADAVERMLAFYRKHLGEPWRVRKASGEGPAAAHRP